MDLNQWLDRTRLVVCVGSGGVGKTTAAAAIGLWGALRGRKVIVVTIDPARRLANSLGLNQMGDEETRIPLPDAAPGGELWALMLDSRRTFHDLVARISPSKEVEERILANHVYRHMADTFAGSQDYMATEKLYDMVVSGRYELLVLDTPPVKNALDFLESPGRLVNFLDERVLRWFLHPPQGMSRRLVAGTSTVVHFLLAHVFGNDFLDDLAAFFRDFEGLFEGFRRRHAAVLELFADPATQFVTVCAPTEPSVDVATFFQEELAARGLPRGGVVANQVHLAEGSSHDAAALLAPVTQQVGGDLPEAVVRSTLARLGMAHRRLYEIARADAALQERVKRAAHGGGFYARIPRLDTEVHDLGTLREVGSHLFETPAEPL